MKLGQGLKTLITKRGRTILDMTGSKWDVFDQLGDTLSNITSKLIEIEHEGDCTFNLYVDGKHTAWTEDGLTAYELYLLEEAIQKQIAGKGYKIQLTEA